MREAVSHNKGSALKSQRTSCTWKWLPKVGGGKSRVNPYKLSLQLAGGKKQPWLPEGSTHSKEYQCLVCMCACARTCDHTNYISSDSSVHGISRERILEWGCHFLFQEIFLTQGLNLCLLHWQADSLSLSYQGSLKVLNIRKLLQAHRIILYVN